MRELGIYIHIPFCVSKCFYCDFLSFADKEDKIKSYVNALVRDISNFDFSNFLVSTIYIGGGTPSILDIDLIEKIVDALKAKIKLNNAEFTIEVNPGTVDENKLEKYKELGINRISFGLQSTSNKILKSIGRVHTYEQFLQNYSIAIKLGFNTSIDLILALPNSSIKQNKEQLEQILKLEPDHISTYSLSIEEGTVFSKNKDNLNLPDEKTERQMYWQTKHFLEDNGYIHYEISNFAKKTNEKNANTKNTRMSKHNLNCWDQKEYIGFGLGASSYINDVRFSNTRDLEQFIEENKITIEETQNKDEKEAEFFFLGLRKIDGISIKDFENRFCDSIDKFDVKLEFLQNNGLLKVDGDNIRLTDKGLDFANVVFEEFVE